MVFKGFLSKQKEIDILAYLPDGVMVVSEDGKLNWINESILTLFDLDKNSIFKYDIDDLIEDGMTLLNTSVNTMHSTVGKIKLTNLYEAYVEISAKKTRNCFVVSLRDATQNYKKVTNIIVEHESSKKANNDKNTFLVKLANEIRSPIQSVIGFSQAILDGLGGRMSDKQEKYIKIINKNSYDSLYFINKVIELSKTEADLFDYDFQIFDVVNSSQSVLKEFEASAKVKNLELNFDASEIVKKTIFSDENAIKTILQNILETSISSTDIGSVSVAIQYPTTEILAAQNIEITDTVNEKSFLLMVVKDTGVGYVDGDLQIAFDPYAQLDKSNKKNIVRSIALASVKNLINHLKGYVWIESQPMQGATYKLLIPVGRI